MPLKNLGVLSESTLLEYNESTQVFISESGLYSLVLGSQKAEAKVFQRWITNEVLPSIRKTGQYTLNTGADMSKKRAELEMAEIDERIQTCKRRCIEEHKASERRCIEDGLLSMQRLGLKLDDRDMMRAKDCINEITFGRLQDTPYDDEINIRTFLTKHGIRDPSMDCKLGKVGKRLFLDDHPDYEFQQTTNLSRRPSCAREHMGEVHGILPGTRAQRDHGKGSDRTDKKGTGQHAL